MVKRIDPVPSDKIGIWFDYNHPLPFMILIS